MGRECLCKEVTYETCVMRKDMGEEPFRAGEQPAQRPWGGSRSGPVWDPEMRIAELSVRARVVEGEGEGWVPIQVSGCVRP